MNRALFRTRGIAVVIVLAICQVLSLSCSTRLYPASSFVNIESQKEKQELEEFLSSGTGKVLNTQNTSADEIIEAAKNYLGVPHCMGWNYEEMHGLLRISHDRFCHSQHSASAQL